MPRETPPEVKNDAWRRYLCGKKARIQEMLPRISCAGVTLGDRDVWTVIDALRQGPFRPRAGQDFEEALDEHLHAVIVQICGERARVFLSREQMRERIAGSSAYRQSMGDNLN